jgi:hypothetical protein
VVETTLSGVFLRGDGDHKFVTVESELANRIGNCEWDDLPDRQRQELLKLYPRIGEGEGWHGVDVARGLLLHEPPASS